MRPTVRACVAALLAAVVLAGCGTATWEGGAAAVVDGVAVSRTVLEESVRELTGEQAPTEDPFAEDAEDPDLQPTAQERAEQVGQTQRRVLGFQIQAALIESVAREQGVEVSQADLDAAREQIVAAVGGEEVLPQALAQAQLTMTVFEEVIVPQEAYVAGLRDELLAEQEGLTTRTARHILVGSQQEADEVVAELEAGADFAQLAAERSTDPGSAANGGELPASPRGAFVPEFDEAVWEAELGEVVGPVQTDFGFHVIEVIDEQTVSPAELDPAQADALVGQELEALLAEAFEEAEIRVAPGLGEWDPTTRSVVPAGQVGTGTPTGEPELELGS